MATDREYMVLGLGNAIVGSNPNVDDAAEAAKAMQRRVYRIQKLSADTVAADVTTNGVCAGNGTATFSHSFTVYRKSKLVAARLIPGTNTGVTEHTSNFCTVNVTKDNGGGGSQTVVLSNTTKPTANGGIGNIPTMGAGTYVSLTSSIVAAAAVCDAGSSFRLQIAKASSGTALQPFTLELDFEEV